MKRLLRWFRRNGRDLPWRRTQDPYAIWVSEIMLQQTQVKTVSAYWERWIGRFPTIESLARANPSEVLQYWAGLGYYSRARNLHRAAQAIMTDHGGKFPQDFQAIVALPGIGPYTAGAICSIAFNQPTPILDGNVTRVLARFFGVEAPADGTEGRRRLWGFADQLITTASRQRSPGDRSCSDFNQALMELGALVCQPKHPDCHRCPLRAKCTAFQTGSTRRLPRVQRRKETIPLELAVFVVKHQGRWLVRQRLDERVNAGLWEFPNLEIPSSLPSAASLARQALGRVPRSLTYLGEIQHSITRYRIRLRVYQVRLSPSAPSASRRNGHRWHHLPTLRQLPMAGAHRKILERFLPPPRSSRTQSSGPKP